ncbi:hypothetical protein D3C75_831610 [compost metagenome]
MGQALQWADQVGTRAEFQWCFARADFQVATHARGKVDDDVHVGFTDAFHDFAIQRHVTAEAAGLRVAHVAVDYGGAGFGGLYGRLGDLLGGDWNKVAFRGGVAGAGEGAGDDDVVVHGGVPCNVWLAGSL